MWLLPNSVKNIEIILRVFKTVTILTFHSIDTPFGFSLQNSVDVTNKLQVTVFFFICRECLHIGYMDCDYILCSYIT